MARNIVLKSSDGVVFEVDELAAVQSKLIEFMIEAENGILLPKVTSAILSKVIEYCKKHADAAAADEDLRSWDAEFVSTVDQATLFDLILAANYMENEGLLSLTCQAVADQIKGKTPEEIRRTFNLKNEFTPEEEEEVRRENPWAFE